MCSIVYDKLRNVHLDTTRYFDIVLLQYLFTNNLYKRCLAYVNQLTLCDSHVVCLVLFVIRTTFHSDLLVCFLEFIVPFNCFFTHMEMPPLPVKGCKIWSMLSTHGHGTIRVL